MAHTAKLEHHTHGRVRIRVPSAKGDPEALSQIRTALASVAGVQSVTVNETLGTVTVNYDPDSHTEVHEHLTAPHPDKTVTLHTAPSFDDMQHVDRMVEKEAEFLSDHSKVAQALFELVRQMDQGVKRATGNFVDLKVIAPLVLAGGVFLELGIAAATPVWLTLGLFSFNHFIDLHTHPQTRQSADSDNPQAEPDTQRTEPTPQPSSRTTRRPRRFP